VTSVRFDGLKMVCIVTIHVVSVTLSVQLLYCYYLSQFHVNTFLCVKQFHVNTFCVWNNSM
jgi:hypothetical protein